MVVPLLAVTCMLRRHSLVMRMQGFFDQMLLGLVVEGFGWFPWLQGMVRMMRMGIVIHNLAF